MMRQCVTLFFRTLSALLITTVFSLHAAASSRNHNPEYLELLIQQGELITLPEPAKAVFIADPTVASYQAPSSRSLFLFGQSAGTTTFYVLGKNEKVIYSRRVHVKHDVNTLNQLIQSQFPDSDVSVTSTANRMILTGSVATPDQADAISHLAAGFLSSSDPDAIRQELINQLTISLPTQVNIRVRIAEMDRRTARDFGFNTDINVMYAVPLKTIAPFSNSLTARLNAMEEESLLSILAEPNLTAVSGEQAQFLSGGQFPVFIRGNNGETTVEYRDFGVQLDITPTVLSPERISLRVRPAVSELSETAAVQIDGINIPSVSIRSAQTTVELASGQSFILGGLLHERENTLMSEIPWISDIPILGALFRSERYQRQETELVIIATAYIVQPDQQNNFSIPQQGMEPASHWERFLHGRILKPGNNSSTNLLDENDTIKAGDYGFIF